MYQLCVILLKIVRRYCVYRCGDLWHNLWRDMIGDARCYPEPPPSVEPTGLKPPLLEILLEQTLKIASLGQLLHCTVATNKFNVYDVEDTHSYLAFQVEWFSELIDLLQVEPAQPYPLKRRVTKLSALYDKYRHNLTETV